MSKEIGMVGERLREMRRVRNWTQEDLADRAGLEQSQVSSWERGSRRPSMDSARKLAAAFDMSQEELAREIGYLDPEPEVSRGGGGDRAPLARLAAALLALPTGKGYPTPGEWLQRIDSLEPAAQERVIRRLAGDIRHALARELERESDAACPTDHNSVANGLT